MEEKFTKAKYGEWQASLFGACGIALGLGVLLAPYLHSWALWLITGGVIMHGWGYVSDSQKKQLGLIETLFLNSTRKWYNLIMEFNKFMSNPNKILLSLLILCAIIGAGFTVFCQMPGNTHSYNLLVGKDECQSGQPARDCGSTQLSQDTLGFSLLDNSLIVKVLSGLLVALLGFILVFFGTTPSLRAGIKKWFCFQFLTRLHNYLIQAFSQGLLNPRIFAL